MAARPLPLHFDFVDLRLLVSVADAGNLTRGAARSALSLGAASSRIKGLEDSLGVRLFHRTQRGVSPSPAGLALLHHARHMLLQLDNIHGDMQEYARGIKGHISVFANTTATAEFLPETLAHFLATHPPVSIDLQEHLSLDVVRAVQEERAHIGIVAGDIRTYDLETLPYKRDRLVLATARGHSLAAFRKIDFQRALDYDFVGLQERTAIHAFLSRIVTGLNQELKLRIQVGNFDAMCQMIEQGVGIGVLPASAARRHRKSATLRIIELNDEWAVRELKICLRKLQDLPTPARQLVDCLVDSASAKPADARRCGAPSPSR